MPLSPARGHFKQAIDLLVGVEESNAGTKLGAPISHSQGDGSLIQGLVNHVEVMSVLERDDGCSITPGCQDIVPLGSESFVETVRQRHRMPFDILYSDPEQVIEGGA